jgi:hypothetical protein
MKIRELGKDKPTSSLHQTSQTSVFELLKDWS